MVNVIFRLAVVLRNKMPSLRLVKISRPHLTLHINSVGNFIVDIIRRGGIVFQLG